MSTDLERKLMACAPDPQGAPDLGAVIRAGVRRRRRRAATRIAGVATVLVGVLMTSWSPDTATTTLTLQGSPPRRAGNASASADTQWATVSPGNSLELPIAKWDELPRASGDPTIEQIWRPRTRVLLHAATTANRESVLSAVAVGPQGAAVFAFDDGPGAVLAEANGSQHLIAENLTNIAVVWAPAGGWLLLGEDDAGRRVVQRLRPDGRVSATQWLRSYPERVGQTLQVRGDEIWVVAAWEAVDADGPREALVAGDGGRALVRDVTWRMAPVDKGAVVADSPNRLSIPLTAGVATISLRPDAEDRDDVATISVTRITDRKGQDVYTVHIHAVPITDGGRRPIVLRSSVPPDLSLLVVAGTDAQVTRLETSSAQDRAIFDHNGDIWFVQIDGDGYRLSRLHPTP